VRRTAQVLTLSCRGCEIRSVDFSPARKMMATRSGDNSAQYGRRYRSRTADTAMAGWGLPAATKLTGRADMDN